MMMVIMHESLLYYRKMCGIRCKEDPALITMMILAQYCVSSDCPDDAGTVLYIIRIAVMIMAQYCVSSDCRDDHGTVLCIIRLPWWSWHSTVYHQIAVMILAQYCVSSDYHGDPGTVLCIIRLPCWSWQSTVYHQIAVMMILAQYCVSSYYHCDPGTVLCIIRLPWWSWQSTVYYQIAMVIQAQCCVSSDCHGDPGTVLCIIRLPWWSWHRTVYHLEGSVLMQAKADLHVRWHKPILPNSHPRMLVHQEPLGDSAWLSLPTHSFSLGQYFSILFIISEIIQSHQKCFANHYLIMVWKQFLWLKLIACNMMIQ